MSRVFVVQMQMRFDHDKGSLVPKFDLSSASVFGKVHYLLSPSAAPFSPESILRELHEKLRDFSGQDFLLLIGNPVLMGWAAAIAADYSEGHLNILQWSGKDRKYIPVEVKNLYMEI